MNYKFISEGDTLLLPRDGVLEHLRDADGVKLRVLLSLASDPGLDEKQLCETLDITERSLGRALAFWEKAGVIECNKAQPTAPKQAKKPAAENEKKASSIKPMARAAELPKYTSEEIAEFISANAGVRQLLFDCQQLLGKLFNMAETEIVIGLLDYLKLDESYVLLLCAHCARMNKKSLRYIEKLAIGFFDRGILDFEELDSHLGAIEAAAETDRPLRKLFGVGSRALTKKEREAFTRWCGEWKLPLAVVERAYEITVENTGGASVPYCNAVLERWHTSGWDTPEKVDAAMEQYRHDKSGVKDSKSASFETDDFFEAALRRSYGKKSKEGEA